jgi:pyridoxal phosphate enzyme (YggS family)
LTIIVDTDRLFENIKIVYRKISHAAMKAGRNPDEVKLVPVTKSVDAKTIKAAVECGLRVFGENRVQEAKRKITGDELQTLCERIEWHLIGHLQKNKTKDAVRLFELIHSVDSLSLAEELDRQAGKTGKLQRVLVQVKLSEEETKYGADESEVPALLTGMQGLHHLKLEGLMTIPPFFDEGEGARPFFRRLRQMRDHAVKQGFRLPELSMGMSNDFEVAIEEGATMVRIGTAIFGERGYA